MRLGLGLGLARLRGSSIDPAAAAYFAATGLTGATEKAAVNTLVRSLKSAGLWSKMKAVYPFVTDNRNLLSYTEDFGNAYWQKGNTTITTNTTTAPNGTNTADKISETSASGYHFNAISDGAMGNTNNYTLSFYAKASERTWCSVYLYDGSTLYQTFFDLANGGIGTIGSGMTASIESAGNGWYRCRVSRNIVGAVGANGGILTATGNGQSSYAGTAGNGIFAWGAQLELGSTATTYQPIATTQQSYISNQFKYNLVNPVDSDAAFRGVFNGGWTFSNNGATPNGTNGYMDTKLLGGTDLLTNNSGIGIYSGSNTTSTGGFGTGANFHMYPRYTDNNTYYRPMNASGGTSVNNLTALGMFHQYSDGTNGNAFFNGTKKGATTVNQTMDTANLFFGGQRPALSNYDNKQLRFAFASLFLTDTEATALYNAVQTFNSTLNRAI